jgi:homoserine O-acetyltransferase/O-succinyltransferase
LTPKEKDLHNHLLPHSISNAISFEAPPFLQKGLFRLICLLKRLDEQLLNPVESRFATGQPVFKTDRESIHRHRPLLYPRGVTLCNVPIAYTTRGQLSPNRDNALVICHALSGSADVADWWGSLLGGPGRAFDVTRFLVVCLNSLGSPYGSASPVT